MDGPNETVRKAATSARMYDFYLGGAHNFAADRQAALKVIEQYPAVPAVARANRAFLGRAVRFLADAGVRQFLDIGSGIPTVGNVHEIAQRAAPDARVVYVDIDPVAVAESRELLHGNDRATAIHGDLRDPKAIVANQGLLDVTRPVAVVLAAVLHFVPDDTQAYGLVDELLAVLPAGSHLVVSHGAAETFGLGDERTAAARAVYTRQTSTAGKPRTKQEVERFFGSRCALVDPGVTWAPDWRPAAGDPTDFAYDTRRSGMWAAVGLVQAA
ncbi:O-Methyltransferase involved in polyketide biosynthesis [Asanoa hainanensis]|uniref:O-Methyltransferase involved in polyketide biosynthesis n=1 Tax=Asanoa hainanensis TaxID=560556 RepID=A0A239NLX4_9ACTN|nr:SAM-dependent methyltransferase [Asanoa hainanensis]SNT55358.1 O-Methyltransferase involved in polyketide biosynthesis [Asanoa hainanensis]